MSGTQTPPKQRTSWKLPTLAGLSWKQIARRVWHESARDRLYNRAAELAFWFLLGFFPMLLFATSITAMMVSGSQQMVMKYMRSVLPEGASSLVQNVLSQIQGSGKAWFSLIFALWSASSATSGLIDTLNVIYDLEEDRTFWKKQVIAVALAVGMGGFIMIAVSIVVYSTALLRHVSIGSSVLPIWNIAQYPAAAFLVAFALLLVYRYAPNVREQKWKWLVPGSLFATGAWLGMSLLFRVYVRNFSNFGLLYGSVGTLVILMFWFFLSGAAILVGGEMNAVLESAAADRQVPGAKRLGEKEAGRKS